MTCFTNVYNTYIPQNHYGQNTSNYFFPKFTSLICINDLNLNQNFFKRNIFNNINRLFSIFIEEFPKFNLYIKNFDYLENYENTL